MQLILEKNLRKKDAVSKKADHIKNKTTLELYKEFYESVTEREFDRQRKEIMISLIDEIKGDGLL